jgi:biotin synthase
MDAVGQKQHGWEPKIPAPAGGIDPQIRELVDQAVAGQTLTRHQVRQLYEVAAYSPESYYLQWGAHQVAFAASGGKGLLYAQLGLDANPCSGNCDFCSFAASSTQSAWDEARTLSLEDIIAYSKAFSDNGVHLISLMTTADYDFERFLEAARVVRKTIHPRISLMANIGDFGADEALRLKVAGIDTVYHAVRIGEGVITNIPPKRRYATIDAVREAGLTLMSGVEPIYADQEADAVIERLREVAAWDVICSGLGPLRTVRGTRMESHECLSEPRLRVLFSLFRLVAGTHIPYGSENTRWVDGGTNPRDNHMFPGNETIAKSIDALKRDLENYEWRVPTLDENWYW